SKGNYLQRDTLIYYNEDFSKINGYLWINPSTSTLWSDNLDEGETNHSAKKQGMTIIGNSIFQTVGGYYDGSKNNVYHLQGVQELGPHGNVINDYTYKPEEFMSYLESVGKKPYILEHEGAYTFNNRLYSSIVYRGRTHTGAQNQGVLIVEYGGEEKDYTFNESGKPYSTPTVNYNPYKANIDGVLYNEYTGEKLESIKQILKYMVKTYQSKIVFYTTETKNIKNYDGVVLDSGLKVVIENLNNNAFHVTYKGYSTEDFYIMNYDRTTGEYKKTIGNLDRRYTGVDLLSINYKVEGYFLNTINQPSGVSSYGWVKSNSDGNTTRITYTPYNSYDSYVNFGQDGVWQGWKKVTTVSP